MPCEWVFRELTTYARIYIYTCASNRESWHPQDVPETMRLQTVDQNAHSVLQCAAVCCSVLQCVAVRCSVLQCAAVCCSVLQWWDSKGQSEGTQCVTVLRFVEKVCCSVLQCAAVCCSDETPNGRSECTQCVAVCCSVLQCIAVRCSVLQCVAVCCSDETRKVNQKAHNV
jgi:hypothetical protein